MEVSEILKRRALNQIMEQAVPDSLDLWPRIMPRVMPRVARHPGSGKTLSWPSLAASIVSSGRLQGRRLLLVATVATILALVVGLASPLWSSSGNVSAQALLDQAQSAQDAPQGVHSYHLTMIRQTSARAGETVSTEVWYDGASLQRSDQVVKDPSGKAIATAEAVFNGDQAWIATTRNGETTVVHTVGTAWNRPADDPTRPNSLAGVVVQYQPKGGLPEQMTQPASDSAGSPRVVRVPDLPAQASKLAATLAGKTPPAKGAKLQGQATVAGRPTYEIAVIVSPDGESRASEPARMLVWIDKQTSLPLKTEVLDASGTVLDQSVVTGVEYNVAIPASTFRYSTPGGATVSNFTGGSAAQIKQELSPLRASPPFPAKAKP